MVVVVVVVLQKDFAMLGMEVEEKREKEIFISNKRRVSPNQPKDRKKRLKRKSRYPKSERNIKSSDYKKRRQI